MFRLSKLSLTILSVFMVTVLSACTLGQAAAPTATPFDINAVKTNVAETVEAQFTINAPTATIAPTETETQTGIVATNTEGIVMIEETATVAGLASETPIIGFTATPSFTPIGGAIAIPSFTPILGSANTPDDGTICKNSAFAGDVTVYDGTVMKPGEKFEKVWAIKNTGICRWDEGFFFASWSGPPSMAANQGRHQFKTADWFVDPGETINVPILMYAPDKPGPYYAHWQMHDDNGTPFGQDFVVYIIVVK